MKKMNNKGFSLVELIIVIAIMVILVAVIAPQYLKFVNNSKVSTDVQTAADMVTAIDVAVADGAKPFAGTSFDVTKVTNLGSMPMSKYTGTNDKWTVNGDDKNGVTSITLTCADKSGTTAAWQVYPNPDDPTDGFNTKCKQ